MDKYLTTNNPYDMALLLKDWPVCRVAREDFWKDVDDESKYPLPVVFRPGPRKPKYSATKIGAGLRSWLWDVQATDIARENIFFPSSGFFNKGGGGVAPEVVTTSGNFVAVIDYLGERDNPRAILVKTMRPGDSPDPLVVNYRTAALYVHLFMAGDVDNNYHGIASPTGKAAHCYTPVFSPEGQAWISREDEWNSRTRFQMLPKVPFVVTTRHSMNVRSSPEIGDNIVGSVQGPVTVRHLYPSWDGLWLGMTKKKWFCGILKHRDPWVDYNTNFTNLRLDSTLALRPKYEIPVRKEIAVGNIIVFEDDDNVGEIFHDVPNDVFDSIRETLRGGDNTGEEDEIFQKTNQQVINAFYEAAHALELGGWAMLVQGVGQELAVEMAKDENENDLYSGPLISEMGLRDEWEEQLREALFG